MPVYTVRYEGSTYKIRGPEGATPQQLMVQVARQRTPLGESQIEEARAKAPQPEALPMRTPTLAQSVREEAASRPVTDVEIAAVGRPLSRAIIAGQELVGRPIPRQQQSLEALEAIEAPGAWTGPSEVLGTAGAMALPMAAGGRALGAGQRAMPALRRALGEAAGAAGYGYAATPGPQRRRQTAAAIEAGSTIGGQGVGQMLSKAMRGVRVRPEAQALMDEGVRLTPGQAAQSPLVRLLEQFSTYIPGTAQPAAGLQQTALRDWNRRLLQSVIPNAPGAVGTRVTATGTEGFRQVQDAFSRAYGKVYDDIAGAINPEAFPSAAQFLQKRLQDTAEANLGDEAIGRLVKPLRVRLETLAKDPTAGRIQNFSEFLQKQKASAVKKGELAEEEVIDGLIQQWDDFLGTVAPESVDTVRELGRAYRDFSTLMNAASRTTGVARGGLEGNLIAPQELTNALARGSDYAVSGGRLPMHGEVNIANELLAGRTGKENVFGQVIVGGAGAGGASLVGGPLHAAGTIAAPFAFGRAFMNQPTRRAILGQTPAQRNFTEMMAEALRRRSGRLGAALPIGQQ